MSATLPLPWPSAQKSIHWIDFCAWRHTGSEVVKIRGETHYLLRAVDHESEVMESYVTNTRDKSAALRFLKKAMKR